MVCAPPLTPWRELRVWLHDWVDLYNERWRIECHCFQKGNIHWRVSILITYFIKIEAPKRSLHLPILVNVVRVLGRDAGNSAADVLFKLELDVGIDAIELSLRQGAQLAFSGGAGARELVFLVSDL